MVSPARQSSLFRSHHTKLGRVLCPLLVFVVSMYVFCLLHDAPMPTAASDESNAPRAAVSAAVQMERQVAVTESAGILPSPSAKAVALKPVDVKPKASDERPKAGGRQSIHVMCTSNGSPYLNWQTRIMYETYKSVAGLPESDLRFFTRLLHRRTDDELMKEVPTVRVDSLHEKCDTWCDFPVADRPNAVAKWLETEDSHLGDWILMIETDYVWMKPLAAPLAGSDAIAFQFGYIDPMFPGVSDQIKRLWPEGDPKDVPRSGPAPALLTRAMLARLMPDWESMAAQIEADPIMKERLGWVREMYAYSTAAAKVGVKHVLREKDSELIQQPPADDALNRAAMYHYTWGTQFKKGQDVVWQFDKRTFTEVEKVRRPKEYRLELPPGDYAELRVQDGRAITPRLHAVLTDMVSTMNKAIDKLPDLEGCGWANDPPCKTNCPAGKLCVP